MFLVYAILLSLLSPSYSHAMDIELQIVPTNKSSPLIPYYQQFDLIIQKGELADFKSLVNTNKELQKEESLTILRNKIEIQHQFLNEKSKTIKKQIVSYGIGAFVFAAYGTLHTILNGKRTRILFGDENENKNNTEGFLSPECQAQYNANNFVADVDLWSNGIMPILLSGGLSATCSVKMYDSLCKLFTNKLRIKELGEMNSYLNSFSSSEES